MSRINEFQTTKKSCRNIGDALKTIDNLDREVSRRKKEILFETESESLYRSHVTGLKKTIEDKYFSSFKQWETLELGHSFCQISETIAPDGFQCGIRFIQPRYEHIWFTDSQNRNVSVDFLPFVEMNLDYKRNSGTVTIHQTILDPRVNLPDLRASYRSAEEDLGLIREETERAKTIIQATLDWTLLLMQEIEEYCKTHQLTYSKLDENEAKPSGRKSNFAGLNSRKPADDSSPTPPPQETSASHDYDEEEEETVGQEDYATDDPSQSEETASASPEKPRSEEQKDQSETAETTPKEPAKSEPRDNSKSKMTSQFSSRGKLQRKKFPPMRAERISQKGA